ncbi:unnamed protein product [Lota lota]
MRQPHLIITDPPLEGPSKGFALGPVQHSSFHPDALIKMADSTAVVGLVSNHDEKACLEEVENLEPGPPAPGQQSPPQRRRDKGADSGVWEEAEELPPSLDMDSTRGHKGTGVSFSPQTSLGKFRVSRQILRTFHTRPLVEHHP